jgi:hypothetical protein
MTPKQAEAIKRHGEQLNAIFQTGLDPVELCKKLHRIQSQADRYISAYCNGDIDDIDSQTEKTLDRLDKLLNFRAKNIPVFVNRDPRGYALKISDYYIRQADIKIHRDWGGYGILCPEFDKFGN